MTAVALEEKYPEQGERPKDIGLKRRRLHLLNISEHLLNISQKHCKTFIRKGVSLAKQVGVFCKELIFLK